jgi:hypothetical protein
MKHDKIMTYDFAATFPHYSRERLQDLVNEFRTELPGMAALLFEMKMTRSKRIEKTRQKKWIYTNDELIKKIKDIMDHHNFRFANGQVANPRALAQFMYKIDFITARKVLDDGKIDRKFFDQRRYLQNQFTEFGYDWEIHPAYRWALAPLEEEGITENIELEGAGGTAL